MLRLAAIVPVTLLLTACLVSPPTLKFSTTTIKVGKSASSIEAADFTNDGFLDIVVANAGDSSVALLPGSMDGIFAPVNSSSFYCGHFPNDLDCADFNNDGNMDVLVANHERKFMTLLLGNGKGALLASATSPIRVDVRPHVHGVASADFNLDGHRDCVTDSWGTDKIVVLSGADQGTFLNPISYEVGDHPYQRIRVADFNKDGAYDIVTTNLESNNATILLNDGKGKFRQHGDFTYPCGDAPFGVAVGDLNGDGNMDLAIINSVSLSNRPGKDRLFILSGDGTGKFTLQDQQGLATGVGPSRVAIGDINGDGVQDIAVTNYRNNSVSIYILKKDLTPDTYILKTGKNPDGVTIADTDRDHKGEIYVGNSGENTITVINLNP